ncbi:hypothetical protein LguiA_025866 [Lonicera macranthoides]
MVVNLQHLKLSDCWMIEQVIRTEEGEKEEDEEDIFEVKMMDKIVFPQLRIISLDELENLRVFCIRKHDFELPLLEEVFIAKCPNMKTFSYGQLITPKLEQVWIYGVDVFNDQSRWKGDLNSTLAYMSARENPMMHRSSNPFSPFMREDPQDSSERVPQ